MFSPWSVGSPAKTFTPINLWDVNLRASESAELPLPGGHTTDYFAQHRASSRPLLRSTGATLGSLGCRTSRVTNESLLG